MPRSANSKPYRTSKGTSSAYHAKGRELSEKAMLYGFIGLFFMGIVLGPISLRYAREAALYGNYAHNKLLGVLATVIGVIGVLFILMLIFSSMQPDLIEPGLAPTTAP